MKKIIIILMSALLVSLASCNGGRGDGGQGEDRKKHQADTGFTGIKNYFKGDLKVKEAEYSNGIRNGMTRTFYMGGVTEQEIMYRNGVKEGESKWYYPDGKLFRVTPYLNDTINGSQIQYYKSGRVKAKLDYVNGMRVPGLEEYTINGVRITDYPVVSYHVTDDYMEKGTYKIFIEMSDKAENVHYYRGDFVNGLVDLSSCTELLQTATTGYLTLKKGAVTGADSVVVIASYLTKYGNRLYYRLAVPVPYKDLN